MFIAEVIGGMRDLVTSTTHGRTAKTAHKPTRIEIRLDRLSEAI
jgi:hypothetical protein